MYWSKPIQAAILLCIATVTGFLLPHALHIQSLPPENILAGEVPENAWLRGERQAEQYLPAEQETLVVVVEAKEGDLFLHANVEEIRSLTHALLAVAAIDAPLSESLATFSLVRQDDGVRRLTTHPLDELLATPPNDYARAVAHLKEDLAQSYAYKRLIAPDWQASVIVLYAKKGEDDADVAQQVREAIAPYQYGRLFVGLAGGIPLRTDINNGIQHDASILAPIAFVAAALLFGYLLQSGFAVVLALVFFAASIIWTLGCMDLMGVRFNAVTSSIPLFVVALGNYPYHFMFYYRRLWGRPHRERVHETIAALFVPTLLATVTTVVGFGSLYPFKIKAVSEFGVFLAMGTICLFLLTMTIVPAVLFLWGKDRLPYRPRAQRALVEDLSQRMVQFSTVHASAILIALLVGMPLLCAVVLATVRTGSTPVDFLPQDSELRQVLKVLDRHFGASRGVAVVVVFPEEQALLSAERQQQLTAAYNTLTRDPRMARIDGLPAVLMSLRQEFGRSVETPADPVLLQAELSLFRKNQRFPYFQTVHHPGLQATRLFLWSPEVKDTVRLKRLLRDVQDTIQRMIPGAQALPAGPLVHWIAEEEYIVPGKVNNITFGLVGDFLLCALFGLWMGGLRHGVLLGVVCTVPTALAALLTFMLFPVFGIRLDLANLVVTSLCLGVVPDFAIHYMSHEESAPAVVGDALSHAVGFAVFPLFARLVPLATFGGLIVWTMLIAPVVALTTVTAIKTRWGEPQESVVRKEAFYGEQTA